MKTGISIKTYMFIASLIGTILLSISVAILTYQHYGIVVRGILGIVLLYLIFSGERFSKNDVSIKTLLLDPQKGKYLFYALIDPLISCWAAMQILEMVLFFWNR